MKSLGNIIPRTFKSEFKDEMVHFKYFISQLDDRTGNEKILPAQKSFLALIFGNMAKSGIPNVI